jgi:hypothetical protein
MGRWVLVFVLLTLLLIPSQAAGQYLYFSPNGGCASDGVSCWVYFQTYYIFLRIPDVHDATGASFRLESEAFGPEDFASVNAYGDVVIEGGDVFTGITLSWPSGLYDNDTLLTIPIELNEPHSDLYPWLIGRTRDIEIYTASGDTLQLDNFLFFCSHCHGGGGGISWDRPDTVTAVIGEQTTIDISAIGSADGVTGTHLDALDQLGWVSGCSHCSVTCVCAPCPWDVQHVLVHISIPSDVQDGTVDEVRLIPSGPCCLRDSTSFLVKAVAPIAVEKSSWGRMKNLFKDG